MRLSSLHSSSVNEALKGSYDVYIWAGDYATRNIPDKEMVLINPKFQLQTMASSPAKAINNAVYRVLKERLKRDPVNHEISYFRNQHYIRAFPEPSRKAELPPPKPPKPTQGKLF